MFLTIFFILFWGTILAYAIKESCDRHKNKVSFLRKNGKNDRII